MVDNVILPFASLLVVTFRDRDLLSLHFLFSLRGRKMRNARNYGGGGGTSALIHLSPWPFPIPAF